MKAIKKYWLDYFEATCGTDPVHSATVRLHDADHNPVDATVNDGDGPVSATFTAIVSLYDLPGANLRLTEFVVQSLGESADAVGEVRVMVTLDRSHGSLGFSGTATSTDIVEAAVRAYIEALNQLVDQLNLERLLTSPIRPKSADPVSEDDSHEIDYPDADSTEATLRNSEP